MATVLRVADLDPELLAALRAATPEQIGDDLVLRLADGRIYFIDGYFALDEAGDGVAPEPDAVELAREVADALLGAPEIDTAAGGEIPATVPNTGTGFQSFDGTEQAETTEPEPAEEDGEEIEATRGASAIDRTQRNDDYGEAGQALGGTGVSLNLRAIGSISLAAGGADAPTWLTSLGLREIVQLEDLADTSTDSYPGLTRLLAMGEPLDFATFALRFDSLSVTSQPATTFEHNVYLGKRADWLELADGRAIWANLTPGHGSFGDRDNSLPDNLPTGITPASLFGGHDLIIGADHGWDRLNGFDGNDILVGYRGDNHLVGGSGDDVLITTQRSGTNQQAILEGGDGDDTLILSVDNEKWVLRLADLGTVSGIERLILSAQSMEKPDYLNDDFSSGRIVQDRLLLDLDAASIHAWGGHLIVDGTEAAVRLGDVENWERLPIDPADAYYVHYRTIYAGETVTLAVRAGADQPITDFVTGTAVNDSFFLGDWRFREIDGGAGNDQVHGYRLGAPLGDLNLGTAATVPFRNIENFVLADAGDTITLSAASVAAMTDARNTLWLTSPGFGYANVPPDGLPVDHGGTGSVHLVDPAAWTALGFMSVATTQDSNVETRMGAVYGATVKGEAVYLFIQVGMQQPVVGNTTAADYWFVDHAGWVSLPRADVMLNLAVTDLANDLANQIVFSVAAVDRLAGPDGILTVKGDGGLDTVNLLDMPNWHYAGTNAQFAIYHGTDADGHQVELRIAADLIQPTTLPDPAGGLDLIDLSNGRPDTLLFDLDNAALYAGDDRKLDIDGDDTDRLDFADPANWQLSGRDGDYFIYQGDDGTTQVTLEIHADIGRPLFLPSFTEGDDDIVLADVLAVTQYGYFDGKGGFDTLSLMDGGLIVPPLGFMKHVEAVDLRNSVANTFEIHTITLRGSDIVEPLYITGDANDAVVLDMSSPLFEWEMIGTVAHTGVSAGDFNLYQVTMHFQTGDVTAQVAIDQIMIQPALPI